MPDLFTGEISTIVQKIGEYFVNLGTSGLNYKVQVRVSKVEKPRESSLPEKPSARGIRVLQSGS